MIDIRQTSLVEADFTEPFDDRVDILFHELELATKWQCPSLLLAIYSSEFVHGDAELALENRLLGLGQKAHHIVVKSPEDADVPMLISELADLKNVVVFVDGLRWGCGQTDYDAYRCLNKHREFFIENQIRVVFWLTETEAVHLAHYAPDYWTFRHRVIEFVDAPRPEQVEPQGMEVACHGIEAAAGPAEELDAKITLRAALLSDLPSGDESTAARANLLLTLGILHWRRGDFDQSTRFVNTALELAAKLQDNLFEALCFNATALVDTALGKTEAAIQAYHRAIELAPEQISPWNNLGNLHSKLHQFEEALLAYQKAVEQNPADQISWAGLGDAHTRLDHHQDAIFAYSKHLDLNPGNSHGWVSLGKMYLAEGQADDALAALQKALELDPDNGAIWNELGMLHFGTGAFVEAGHDYARAIELKGASKQTYNNLAKITVQSGDYAGAVPLLQKGIELEPDPAEEALLWNYLGDVHRKLDQYDLAIAAYRKADELGAANAQTKAPTPDEPAKESPVDPKSISKDLAPCPEPQPEAALPPAEAEQVADSAPVASPADCAPVALPEAAPQEDSAAPTPVETPEANLIDDSGTMENESAVDFVKWLENMAARLPLQEPVKEPDNLVPCTEEAAEPLPTSTSPDPLTITLNDFDLYGPAGLRSYATEADSSSENTEPVSTPADPTNVPLAEAAAPESETEPPTDSTALQSSPDVRARLEELRASLSAYRAPTELETTRAEWPLMGDSLPDPLSSDQKEAASPSESPEAPETISAPENPLTASTESAKTVSSEIESTATAGDIAPSPESDSVPVAADDQALPEKEAPSTSASAGNVPFPDDVSLPPAGSSSAAGASSTPTEIDARSAQIWNELGNIYYNIVAYDEAINALNKAIELDHSYGWSYNNLASIYIHKGSYAEAIPLLEKGIPLLSESKDKALLWNRLGDAYRRLDQPEKAAEAYQKAVELDPDNVSLLTRARFSLLGNCRP